MNNFIKDYWESQAKNHQASYKASWGDNFAIDLEILNISKYIQKDSIVLDVGCANGFGTFSQMELKKPTRIYGIDFAENMIMIANNTLKDYTYKDQMEFRVGNIKQIEFENDTFDVVYTTRVLINLPNWEDQIIGINECLRVTKPGGVLIISEAFWEPLILLNSIRILFNLPLLVEHDFNRYLKKEKLENYLKERKLNYECNDFSSIYYLGSRLLRELVTDVSMFPDYSNPINKIFFEIEQNYSGGGIGIQQMYIIKKF